jgi:multidrug resistance efflux pump
MTEPHSPRPEFVSKLEWQIQTAKQRHDRFMTTGKKAGGEGLRMTMLILVSVLFGAAGVWATDEIQEHRTRDMLLAEAEADLQIAGLQLEIVRERLEEVEDHYEEGLVDGETLRAVRVQLQEAESQFTSVMLDIEEIQITGKEPRNDLTAPSVGGRDFVFQRLALHAATARESLSLAESRLERARELEGVGAVDSETVAEAALATAEATHRLELLTIRLSLRDRFLDGSVSAEEADLELERFQAVKDLELFTQAFENAQARLRRLEDLYASGLITESSIRQARLALVQAQVDMERAQRRLALITSLSSPSPSSSPPGGR